VALNWLRKVFAGEPDRKQKHALYIFLDEGGDFNFSQTGTRYFTITSIAKVRPFHVSRALHSLKYDLMEDGHDIETFHASEDKQKTRDRVFEIIKNNLETPVIDCLIVEKRKTGPALQDPSKFYPRMMGYLLKYVLERADMDRVSEVIIVTDSIPLKRKRKAIEKAIKMTLRAELPRETPFRVLHHASKSSFGLQIADYCNWAIYRKWQRGDTRSYDLIKRGIRSEFDIFKNGEIFYY